MKSIILALSLLSSLLADNASAENTDTEWILFKITVMDAMEKLERLGRYSTMFECFDAWNDVDETLPKPKTDVQIICIHSWVDRYTS